MKSQKNAGFTLIELVIVLVVLGILAGLVVPMTGWVRRSANYASGANNQNTVMANFELYRTTFGNNNYPDRLDSLLKADGTTPAYLDSGLSGMITPGVFASTQEFDSINNSGRALKTIMHHPDDLTGVLEGNPGNSGNIAHDITVASTMAFVNTAAGNGLQLAAALYPTGVPADVRLVLLGVGPGNTANGRTMQSPPFDTNVDTSKIYNRFIGVFAVYNPREGRRAQLKAVLCPRGRILNRNLSEFYQSTNPE